MFARIVVMLGAALAVGALNACGQKGPLYIPAPPATSALPAPLDVPSPSQKE